VIFFTNLLYNVYEFVEDRESHQSLLDEARSIYAACYDSVKKTTYLHHAAHRREPIKLFNHILTVCTGNICRSPAAEALFNKATYKQTSPPEIRSAGLGALSGYPADETVKAWLNERGIDASAHRAQPLTAALVHWADLILVMDQSQKATVINAFPNTRGKVYTLGHWLDKEIRDPYKRSSQEYHEALQLIEQSVDAWLVKI
jgi:protein-tyrosine phosphatase